MANEFKPENPSLELAIAQKEAKKQKQLEQNNPAVQELQKQLEEMKRESQVLKTQLQEQKNAELKRQQAEQAEKDAEEANKLAEDADLKKILKMAEDDDKYDSLTNKELINLFSDSLETALEARQKQQSQVLNSKVQDLVNEISKTQKAIMQVATVIDTKDVKAQNPDFDEYQSEAAVIMQDIPHISVEDAYLLAKSRKAKATVSQKDVDREKPNTTMVRSPVDRTAEGEEGLERVRKTSASERRKSGIVGVRDIIDAGLDKIMAQRGETERAY